MGNQAVKATTVEERLFKDLDMAVLSLSVDDVSALCAQVSRHDVSVTQFIIYIFTYKVNLSTTHPKNNAVVVFARVM